MKTQKDTIMKSSTFLSFKENKQVRENYNITNIAWGFLPLKELKENINTFISDAEELKSEGINFHGRVEFDAGWMLFVDYCRENGIIYSDHSCKNIEGKEYIYFWFEGSEYKKMSPNWMSSHSPRFKDFLKYQIDQNLKAPVASIMFDCQTSSALASSSWMGGDFSVHSTEAFRHYLVKTQTPDQLTQIGVDDINSFDYRDFLINLGISTDKILKEKIIEHDQNMIVIPLYEEFRLFQSIAINDLIKEMIQYIRLKEDQAITIGVSSPLDDPHRSSIFEEIDYYQVEQFMFDMEKHYHPVLMYKLGEMLDKSIVLTALQFDWDVFIKDPLKEHLAKGWICNAYANGANFLFPINQYAGTIKGKDVFFTPTSDFSYLGQFIQNNTELFDDYTQNVSSVALIHSQESARRDLFDINTVIEVLQKSNIPFDIILLGDEYYGSTPDFKTLNSYSRVIIPHEVFEKFLNKNLEMSAHFSNLGEKLIKWKKTDFLEKMRAVKNNLKTTISVYSNDVIIDEDVTLYPRISTVSSEAPLIIHMINNDYDFSANKYKEKSDLKISFNNDLFKSEVKSAELYRPGSCPNIELEIINEKGFTTISGISQLEIWGIIVINKTT